jgi:hypothetical protein
MRINLFATWLLLVSFNSFAADCCETDIQRNAIFTGESPDLVTVVSGARTGGYFNLVYVQNTKSNTNIEVFRCKASICDYSFNIQRAQTVLEQAKKEKKKVRFVRETTPRWYWFDREVYRMEIDDGIPVERANSPNISTSREVKKDYRLRGNGYPDCPDSICGKDKAAK